MPLKASERRPNNPVICFVGGPGTGKTTVAAQFPDPYIIDCDKNLSGPFDYIKRTTKGQIDKITYDMVSFEEDVANSTQFKEVPMTRRFARFEKLLSAAYQPSNPCKTVVIDSTTSLAQILECKVRELKGMGVNDKWEFEHWRLYLGIWSTLITQIRDRSKTTIICAHEELEKNDLDQTVRKVLMISGQAKTAIPALVTDVWQFEIKKILVPGKPPEYQRWINTQQDSKNPNLKTSVQCPSASFQATRENLVQIFKNANLE